MAFLEQFSAEVGLSDIEASVIRGAGIRSHAALYNALRTFPGVAEVGVDVAKLSAAAVRGMSSATRAAAAKPLPQTAKAARVSGAQAPAGARAQPGYRVPLRMVNGSAANAPVNPGSAFPAWPVKDQGNRGTCVAFAVVACAEYMAGKGAPSSEQLSEQFLFWATKTRTKDPQPHGDGTFLEFASQALKSVGTCIEPLWPYDGTSHPNNVTHAAPNTAPSALAQQDASARARAGTWALGGKGAANKVRAHIQAGQPVAVTLPVFMDAGALTSNWESDDAYRYGDVAYPLPTAVASAVGHAVCLCGFEPDPTELNGGFFVIRNSWGSGWGFDLPQPTYVATKPGYGQISASYIEDFLWEMFTL